jgi:hypothetical protein
MKIKQTTTFVILVLLITILNENLLHAQYIPVFARENNAALNAICTERSPEGWLYFNEALGLNPDNFLNAYKTSLGLGEADQLIPYFSNTDNTGYLHQKFQQYHKGYKVEGAEVILHSHDHILSVLNGKIAGELNVNISIN